MYEENYRKLIAKALSAPKRQTRNAITRSFFGHHLVVDDLEKGFFPILRGRKLFTNGIFGEMAAFLKGPKTLEDFKSQGCNYWDQWGDENGDIIIDYGNAWRDFNGVDQLAQVIASLQYNPNGRRHLISGWRPDNLDDLSLPCCHYSYQWYVTNDGFLEMIWNQRSVDIMIGLPSDVILAAVWTILIANQLHLKPGKIHMMLGDCHIYESHIDATAQYLMQAEKVAKGYKIFNPLPTWSVAPEASVFNFKPEMLSVQSYNPQPAIKFKLEV